MGKVLVTGAAGYVGSVLVPKLISEGYDVKALDLMIFGARGLKDVRNSCEIIGGDICDEGCLEKALKDVDSVIHLAAISNDPCSDLDPGLTKQVNFEGTRKLLDLSKKAGVQRFIYASSSSVYGLREEPNVTEDLELRPLTIYSETKALSEKLVREANSEDFTTVNIRPATVCGYSPRMRLDLTVNILTDHALNKGEITVFGGDQKRPNIHIEDITDYYIDLLNIDKDKIGGETFNAGYENHTVNEIAEMVRDVVGANVEIIKTPSDDNRSYHISSKKIERTLGLRPKKTIDDAVRDIKNAFCEGLIPNPDDSIYRNIKEMEKVQLGVGDQKEAVEASKIFLVNKNGKDGKIFLYKRDDTPGLVFRGYWDLIGGTREGDDGNLQTVMREIGEEIPGTRIRDIKELEVKYLPERNVEISHFKGLIDAPLEKIKLGEEGTDKGYFSFEDLFDLKLSYVHRNFILNNRSVLGI